MDPTPPARTCVGCRKVCAASELVCLCAPEGRLELACGSARRGRGAWVHPQDRCVTVALKTRAFHRAFRQAVTTPQKDDLLALLVQTAARGS